VLEVTQGEGRGVGLEGRVDGTSGQVCALTG